MNEKKGRSQVKGTAADLEEEFDEATLEKLLRLQGQQRRKEIAARREKLGLLPRRTLFQNEGKTPLDIRSASTSGAHGIEKELQSDRPPLPLGKSLLVGPLEHFWGEPGERKLKSPAIVEVDESLAETNSTVQDRLHDEELRAAAKRAEEPAAAAARRLEDRRKQLEIISNSIKEDEIELARLNLRADAAMAAVEDFLQQHSPAWRESLGKAAASLVAAAREAEESEHRRPVVHTVADIERLKQPPDTRHPAFKIGANGKPEPLPVSRA